MKELFYASLFLSGKPLETEFFEKMMPKKDIKEKLSLYAEEFNSLLLGLNIRNVAGGYQMTADAEFFSKLEPHFGEKSESLSKSALETISIVAYKQPVTKAVIEQLRGVDCSGSIRTLLDRNLICISGRKDVPGRPLLYATTNFFLEYFGLNSLKELPTYKEWSDLQRGALKSENL